MKVWCGLSAVTVFELKPWALPKAGIERGVAPGRGIAKKKHRRHKNGRVSFNRKDRRERIKEFMIYDLRGVGTEGVAMAECQFGG